MNIGVQFLREHMGDKCRVHYAITDAGGRSPNVVQAEASVLYMVRSNKVAEAVELQKRVDDIAQGAALMTGTTLTKKFRRRWRLCPHSTRWRRCCMPTSRRWACPTIPGRHWPLCGQAGRHLPGRRAGAGACRGQQHRAWPPDQCRPCSSRPAMP